MSAQERPAVAVLDHVIVLADAMSRMLAFIVEHSDAEVSSTAQQCRQYSETVAWLSERAADAIAGEGRCERIAATVPDSVLAALRRLEGGKRAARAASADATGVRLVGSAS